MAKQNHVLLGSVTITQNSGPIIFENIPQTGYTDLKIVCSLRSAASLSRDFIEVYLNDDWETGLGDYQSKDLKALGASVNSGTTISGPYLITYGIPGNLATSNVYGNQELYILNYSNTSQYKSIHSDSVGEDNSTSVNIGIVSGVRKSNNAINRIVLSPTSSPYTFVAGSSVSVYGIANASTTPSSSPKAFGGDIVRTDGTYWYHAFLSSGAFTTPMNLNADILIVGGGGGGSNSGGIGSGGGGGAIRYQSSVSLISGSSSAVMVGAGGAKDDTSVGDGRSGTQSSFASTIAQVANRAKGSNSSSGRVGGDGGNSRVTAGGIVGEYFGGLGAASSYPRRGGSGAGAGNSGLSSYPAVGGNGSNTWSSWATATGTGDNGYFSGGGAGGYEYNGSMSRTAGGLGGGGLGGAGTSAPNYNATDGTANTGGGGGGCGGQSGVIGGSSGNGGSGIVIVRYLV